MSYIVNGIAYDRKADFPIEYLDGSITSAVDENGKRSFQATDTSYLDKLPTEGVDNQTSCLTGDGGLGMFNGRTKSWSEVG